MRRPERNRPREEGECVNRRVRKIPPEKWEEKAVSPPKGLRRRKGIYSAGKGKRKKEKGIASEDRCWEKEPDGNEDASHGKKEKKVGLLLT